MANIGQKLRLRPVEWTSGENYWIVDAVGDPRAIVGALKSLMEGPFKGDDAKVATVGDSGSPRIEMLRNLLAKAERVGVAG